MSCSLCKLGYFARMARHSVWHRLPLCIYTHCADSNPGFLLAIQIGSQLSNVVFDRFPFEAYVCLLRSVKFYHSVFLCDPMCYKVGWKWESVV